MFPVKRKKMPRLLPLLLVLVLMLTTACSNGASSSKHDDLLRLPILTTLTTTDPHYTAQNADFMVYTALYESFYEVDSLGNMTPRLATSYDVSDDGLSYTYHLRSGVKWQTGGEFKASDVLFSIRRAQESPYMAGNVAAIANVEAPDELTVVFTLAGVSPTFHLDISNVMMLSEEATKDLAPGFTNEIPGGTGPYTLTTWAPDQKTVIARNADYYGDPAPIGTIEFNVFGDSTAALRAFEAGELDWIMVPSADWERISTSDKYKTYREDTITTIYVCMNNQVAPFDDVRVRQAVNYAINRADMLYAAVDDLGRIASCIGNPLIVFGVPGAGEIFEYAYDPDKAKSLLAEAGYPDGLTLEAPILTMGSSEFSIPAQVLQEQLAQVGVTVEVLTMEQSAFIGDALGGNYSICIMGIGLDVDASALAQAYTSANIGGLNIARYSNARVDELFTLASQTLDQDQRKAYFREAFDIASKEAAYAPLYCLQTTIASDKDLASSSYTIYYNWSWE